MNGFDSDSPPAGGMGHPKGWTAVLHHLASDLSLAADCGVPVLISGPPHRTLALARMIVARQDRRDALTGLRICDVARGDDVFVAIAGAHSADSGATVLLREVHRLSYAEQAALAELLADRHVRRAIPKRRVIATSTVSLFDRVMHGTFDARLFYRLNVVHIIVPSTPRL